MIPPTIRPPLLLAMLLALTSSPTVAAETNPTSPDWTLATPEGEPVRLSEAVQDKPVVLLFWASWCPYCKALMPHLQSIRLEYGDEVDILAISFRDEGDPVGYARDAGYDFTLLPDGGAVAERYEVWGTPGLIVVDRDMKIRFDLRELPRKEPPAVTESKSHGRKAAYRAPYWAAEIRKALDTVLGE